MSVSFLVFFICLNSFSRLCIIAFIFLLIQGFFIFLPLSILLGSNNPRESLKKRRTDNRFILLYKCLKGKARIPTDDLIPKTRRCRNSHSKAFQLPSASIEAYKCSFFPQTIRDWNDLPDSLFSTAEMSDDCVSKFASLVRSRDYFLPHPNPLVK